MMSFSYISGNNNLIDSKFIKLIQLFQGKYVSYWKLKTGKWCAIIQYGGRKDTVSEIPNSNYAKKIVNYLRIGAYWDGKNMPYFPYGRYAGNMCAY